MEITIRLAQESDFPAYVDLMQRTYQQAFSNDSLGLPQELFSKEIFQAPGSQKFFRHIMKVDDTQKCWLAFFDNKLIGSITIRKDPGSYHMGGFYVDMMYQGKGIGRKLWQLVLTHTKGEDILLDVYTHNSKAIEIYTKWGFVIDQAKGIQESHWSSWPTGSIIKTLFMRRPGKKSKERI